MSSTSTIEETSPPAYNEQSFEEDGNLEKWMPQTKSSAPNSSQAPPYETLTTTSPYDDSSLHTTSDTQIQFPKERNVLPKDSSSLDAFDASQYRVDQSSQNLIPNGSSRKGWSSYTSLEKTLSVSLGVVSALCLAFMIAVVVVGVKLNEDDYEPPVKATPSTEFPPWVTTLETTTTTSDSGCGTSTLRPRPTTTKPPNYSVNGNAICLTAECVKTAGAILSSLNSSADPCEDFYEFACGGRVKNTHDKPRWGAFDMLHEKMILIIRGILQSEIRDEDPEPVKLAQNFYRACINQGNEDETPLLFEIVHGMVTLSDHDNIDNSETANETNKSQLSVTLGKIRRVLDGDYLFSTIVYIDEKNTSQHTIYLDQPNLGLSRQYLLGKPNNTELEAYETLIKNIWNVFKPEDDNEAVAKNIIIYETMLAKISTAEEDRRNKSEMYNPMTITELSNLTKNSTIVWMDYFQEVFQDVINSSLPFNLQNSTTVVVLDMLYFNYIAVVLNDIHSEILENYLQWRILLDYAKEGRDSLREFYNQYNKKTLGVERPESRSVVCSNKANNYLGMAISYRYVQSRFPTGNYSTFISKVDTMVENIRTAFIDMLDDVDWIANNKTRNAARKKVESMITHIGFPDWLLKPERLQKYYDGLHLRNSSSHMQNCLDVTRWRTWYDLKEIAKSKDPKRWIMTPATVNAAYAPHYNSINLPLGILQSPFFNSRSDDIAALNYGSIGAFIGHEITHGFDDTGKQNDEKGNLRNWWDAKTTQNYAERAACFQKQYGSYKAKISGKKIKVNGITTLGENIADNGGVREAYNAYQRYIAQNGEDKYLPGMSYSPEQLFFLSFAQSLCTSYTPGNLKESITVDAHSPDEFRVKGVVKNSEEFAYAWTCPRPENPKACKIW